MKKRIKKLSEVLNGRRNMKLSRRLNPKRQLPKTIVPVIKGKKYKRENVISVTPEQEQVLAKIFGHKGRVGKHGIRHYPPAGTTGKSTSTSTSNGPTGLKSGPSTGTSGRDDRAPSSGTSANPNNSPSRDGGQGGQGTQNASREAQGNVNGTPSNKNTNPGNGGQNNNNGPQNQNNPGGTGPNADANKNVSGPGKGDSQVTTISKTPAAAEKADETFFKGITPPKNVTEIAKTPAATTPVTTVGPTVEAPPPGWTRNYVNAVGVPINEVYPEAPRTDRMPTIAQSLTKITTPNASTFTKGITPPANVTEINKTPAPNGLTPAYDPFEGWDSTFPGNLAEPDFGNPDVDYQGAFDNLNASIPGFGPENNASIENLNNYAKMQDRVPNAQDWSNNANLGDINGMPGPNDYDNPAIDPGSAFNFNPNVPTPYAKPMLNAPVPRAKPLGLAATVAQRLANPNPAGGVVEGDTGWVGPELQALNDLGPQVPEQDLWKAPPLSAKFGKVIDKVPYLGILSKAKKAITGTSLGDDFANDQTYLNSLSPAKYAEVIEARRAKEKARQDRDEGGGSDKGQNGKKKIPPTDPVITAILSKYTSEGYLA